MSVQRHLGIDFGGCFSVGDTGQPTEPCSWCCAPARTWTPGDMLIPSEEQDSWTEWPEQRQFGDTEEKLDRVAGAKTVRGH